MYVCNRHIYTCVDGGNGLRYRTSLCSLALSGVTQEELLDPEVHVPSHHTSSAVLAERANTSVVLRNASARKERPSSGSLLSIVHTYIRQEPEDHLRGRANYSDSSDWHRRPERGSGCAILRQ